MFKKPKSVIPTLALVGGTLVGAVVSRIGYGLLPAPSSSTTEAMYKGGIAVVAGAGAVFVNGNDAVANLVKGAFIGASVEQGLSLIKGLAQDANVENTMIRRAVGLACPCDSNPLNAYKSLANPQGRVIPLADRFTPTGDTWDRAEENSDSTIFATAL